MATMRRCEELERLDREVAALRRQLLADATGLCSELGGGTARGLAARHPFAWLAAGLVAGTAGGRLSGGFGPGRRRVMRVAAVLASALLRTTGLSFLLGRMPRASWPANGMRHG
jgi:hypothetical protein